MKEPRHTCPTVDRLIQIVKDAVQDLEHHVNELYDADCESKVVEVQSCISNLEQIIDKYGGIAEEIRSNNIELREWGSHWLARSEELERELAESYSQMAKTEREKNDCIDFLDGKIEALEKQLEHQSTQTEL